VRSRSLDRTSAEEIVMVDAKRAAAALLAVSLLFGGLAGCGDDEGEDEIGDGEINDEGD
jgi:hypothetical protein